MYLFLLFSQRNPKGHTIIFFQTLHYFFLFYIINIGSINNHTNSINHTPFNHPINLLQSTLQLPTYNLIIQANTHIFLFIS